MLEIIDNLRPFLEDSYKRVHIRQYSRAQRISPPTASKILRDLYGYGLLRRQVDKKYYCYYANKDSDLLVDLSRIFWKMKLKKSGLLEYLNTELLNPVIVLFGSLSKAEVTQKSDIDLAIFTPSKKEINLDVYERRLRRRIQVMLFADKNSVSPELMNSILNGYILLGSW